MAGTPHPPPKMSCLLLLNALSRREDSSLVEQVWVTFRPLSTFLDRATTAAHSGAAPTSKSGGPCTWAVSLVAVAAGLSPSLLKGHSDTRPRLGKGCLVELGPAGKVPGGGGGSATKSSRPRAPGVRAERVTSGSGKVAAAAGLSRNRARRTRGRQYRCVAQGKAAHEKPPVMGCRGTSEESKALAVPDNPFIGTTGRVA